MRAMPRWLTTEAAQRLTGLSAARLYQLKRVGQVRATHRPDGTNRYHRDSLRQYVESQPEKQGRRRCGWYPERLTGVRLPSDPEDAPPHPPPATPLALRPPSTLDIKAAARHPRRAAAPVHPPSSKGALHECAPTEHAFA